MRHVFHLAFLLSSTVLIWTGCTGGGSKTAGPKQKLAAPVEVAAIHREPIALRRRFSGSLTSPAQYDVAARVAGRVKELRVDLADVVERGDLVALLEPDEVQWDVRQAEAELAEAKADLEAAVRRLEIAEREHRRVMELREKALATDALADEAAADLLARQSQVSVAQARLARAEAARSRTQVRRDYTRVTATESGDGVRVVSRRHVQAGDTVSAGQTLFTLVALDPMVAVIHVTEKDYGLMRPGLPAVIATESFPDQTFEGRLARIAPSFNPQTRQATVELDIANPDGLLKPGMFIRAEVTLDRVERAVTAPVAALVHRGGETGLFMVNESGDHVIWKTVKTGIRQDDRVQIIEPELFGRVVTLGQQLIEDGSAVTIPEMGERLPIQGAGP